MFEMFSVLGPLRKLHVPGESWEGRPGAFWPRAVRDNSAEVVVPVDLPDVQRLFDEVRTR